MVDDEQHKEKGWQVFLLIGKDHLEYVGGRAYRFEQLSGEPIPNTLIVTHLKFYFS